MVNIIATFENAEYGIKSYVTEGAKGFHVSVQDTDTTEFLDLVTIYPTVDRAIAAAQKAAA